MVLKHGTELIRAENIWKSFGQVQALKGISFSLQKGEIRGLVGENGAGKSVFLKILGGVLKPDKGRIYWEGKELRFDSPSDAQKHGYSIVHQEMNLVMGRTVLENIFLGREKDVSGGISLNKRKMQEEAERLMNSFFGVSIPPGKLTKDLDAVEQKLVEVTRALALESKVIVLDETTAQMTSKEKMLLFEHLRNLSNAGVAIIYISHIIPEVFEICDTITVFRDGKNVGTKTVEETSLQQIVEMMTGKSKGLEFAPKSSPGDKVLLSVKKLANVDRVEDISFDLHEGEVLGLVGIRNEGQRDLLRTLAGIVPRKAGKIEAFGKELEHGIPNAVRNGIAYLSDQREREGVFLTRPVSENLSIGNLNPLTRMGIVDTNLENQQVQELVTKYAIRGVASPKAEASSLSGGNRQKLLLARLVSSGAKILLLSEPGRGIDVGAKEEIYSFIPELARQGKGILIFSEDINELVGLCHRVLVIRKGKVKNVLPATRENSEKILEEVYETPGYD